MISVVASVRVIAVGVRNRFNGMRCRTCLDVGTVGVYSDKWKIIKCPACKGKEMKIYEWLYTHLTPWIKRPWTYAIRDARQKYPTPWMLCIMVLSATIGHLWWSWGLLIAFAGILIGILWGHLWYGTKIIIGQK